MRKLLSLIVTAFVAAAPLLANAEIVTSDLTNRWKMDTGSGTTAFDSVGGAHGTFVNSPTWTTDTPGPVPPHALDFEAANADSLSCGTNSVPTGTAGTLDMWLKVDSWTSTPYTTLFAKGPGPSWAQIYLGVLRNSSSEELLFTLSNGSASTTSALGTGPLSLDTWYHLAGTWNGTTANLYLNGNLVDSLGTTITPPNATATYPNYRTDIGWGDYGTRHFDGIIDEVRLYDRALAPEEVLQNYEAVVPEPSSLLLVCAALGCLLLRGFSRNIPART